MSVKRIRLHITAKRKIHDNLGDEEHSTRYLHPHSVFVTSKNFNPLPRKTITITLLHRSTRALADMIKWDVSCITSNISAVE